MILISRIEQIDSFCSVLHHTRHHPSMHSFLAVPCTQTLLPHSNRRSNSKRLLLSPVLAIGSPVKCLLMIRLYKNGG